MIEWITQVAAVVTADEIKVPKTSASPSVITNTIIPFVIAIVGGLSALFVVIGALKYVTSNGDSAAVQSAKNTILYAIVGLVMALSAFIIVNFVLDRV